MAPRAEAQLCRFMAVVICQIMWPWAGLISDLCARMPGCHTLETLGSGLSRHCKGGHGSQVGDVRRPGVSREPTLGHHPVAVEFPWTLHHASLGEEYACVCCWYLLD